MVRKIGKFSIFITKPFRRIPAVEHVVFLKFNGTGRGDGCFSFSSFLSFSLFPESAVQDL